MHANRPERERPDFQRRELHGKSVRRFLRHSAVDYLRHGLRRRRRTQQLQPQSVRRVRLGYRRHAGVGAYQPDGDGLADFEHLRFKLQLDRRLLRDGNCRRPR